MEDRVAFQRAGLQVGRAGFEGAAGLAEEIGPGGGVLARGGPVAGRQLLERGQASPY